MRRRLFLALALVSAPLPRFGLAQGIKPARIGWLTAQRAASLAPYLEALRTGLAELGYVEGKNLAIEYRYGDDAIDRIPDLAAELARLPVDVIVVQGAAVEVVYKLGLPPPVIYVYSGDPISAGFADDLAHPRGHMTGLTFMAAELNGKRLELLRDMLPGLRRVAVLANPEHPGQETERTYTEEAAKRFGLTIEYHPTRSHDELSQVFAVLGKDPPQAISLFADGFAIQNRQSIIDFAMSRRVPVISGWPVFARSGALCTYGPVLDQSYKRLAYYVDRVLRGAKPADLPIERPSRFELVINLKSAKALGVTIPPLILTQANEVIE